MSVVTLVGKWKAGSKQWWLVLAFPNSLCVPLLISTLFNPLTLSIFIHPSFLLLPFSPSFSLPSFSLHSFIFLLGGTNVESDKRALNRESGVDIVVATPGEYGQSLCLRHLLSKSMSSTFSFQSFLFSIIFLPIFLRLLSLSFCLLYIFIFLSILLSLFYFLRRTTSCCYTISDLFQLSHSFFEMQPKAAWWPTCKRHPDSLWNALVWRSWYWMRQIDC